MPSVNKALLLGNLGADPELRQTSNGKSVATFTIATNEKRGDSDHVEWHRIVVWDKQADNCHKYLKKGSPVFIEGRIQTRQWEDRGGQTKYTTEIVAYNVQFLSTGSGGSGGGHRPPPPDDDDGGW